MDANAITLLDIFEKKMRLEIPTFQRQYVWRREHQWEPLWEDIARKFSEFIEDRKDAPVHFLGAMVIDQKQTQTGKVERRSVIDGQQRLTTFQIFLAAFRDFCRAEGLDDFAEECDAYVTNKGRMAESEVERFKVWPTLSDRAQFTSVILAGSKAALEAAYPLIREKYARKPLPRPRMVEAYLFFYDQLAEFFKGSEGIPAVAENMPLADRVEECFEALKTALKVVAIDLDREDDAQVIFETLNARGEPLLPADLLRNYIFLRAARQEEAQEKLYEQYWAGFDQIFWREEVTQGRLKRPRSDLFMQHFLASKQARDIPIKHLFVEYKYWIERDKPFLTVEDELIALVNQRDSYRRIAPDSDDQTFSKLAHFLDVFDVSTVYPPLLAMFDRGATEVEVLRAAEMLESYLIRRAVCGAETKAYNRIFMGLTRAIRESGPTAKVVYDYLSSLRSATDQWLSDEVFARAWMSSDIYNVLNNRRLTYILARVSETYRSAKTEVIKFDSQVTIEHVMPQSWIEHWPLQNGLQGVKDAWLRDEETPEILASKRRDNLIHTFGNLTLITGSLNSAIKHGAWVEKRAGILANSVLPINGRLSQYDSWDEATIEQRGHELLERALKIWPRAEPHLIAVPAEAE
ncbi:RloF protein [Burkholderia vietnamiensis]|uniref:DUF262 domain-containing protein n=1 Tax=Burkholderia vietnamiensis TaxID=60552 RepID=UPI000757FB48|nr:DUF262 domain-containing protein [Burkholderia vietnamiensis]KVE92381.1 RloF protein [Burkholderia vietnamiensis]